MRLKLVMPLALFCVIFVLVSGCTSSSGTSNTTPSPSPPPASTYAPPAGTPTPTAVPTAKPGAAGFSRTSPAAVGSPVSFTSTASDGTKTNVVMTLEEVVRGDSAWQMVKAANMFNSAPSTGKEYLLAKFKVVTSGGNPDKKFELSNIVYFTAISNGGEMDLIIVVMPEPELPDSVYNGGTAEGWTAFEVNANDNAPLIRYGWLTDQYIWFATK